MAVKVNEVFVKRNRLGFAWCDPVKATAGKKIDITLTYVAGEGGISEGGGIQVTLFGRSCWNWLTKDKRIYAFPFNFKNQEIRY